MDHIIESECEEISGQIKKVNPTETVKLVKEWQNGEKLKKNLKMLDLNMSAKQDSAFKIIDKFVGVKKFTETEKQISSGEVRKIRRATDGKIAVLSKILKEEFDNNAQCLDEEITKRIMRKTKLKHKEIADWFVNNRRKIQQKFKNGEIAELPGQMEALEEVKNKEREERGEHLKMRDTEESDEEVFLLKHLYFLKK
ncbi:unnamed protein product [Caenorhabditis brenneri]